MTNMHVRSISYIGDRSSFKYLNQWGHKYLGSQVGGSGPRSEGRACGGNGELAPTDKLHVGVRYRVSCGLLGGVRLLGC